MLSDKPQPFTPLHVLVSEDAEGAQVPFPPVEAYDSMEPQAASLESVSGMEPGVSTWDLRNRLFDRIMGVTDVVMLRYPITEQGWEAVPAARRRILGALEKIEQATRLLNGEEA